MPVRMPCQGIVGLAALLIALASGCSISVQPWTKPAAHPPNSVGEYAIPGLTGGLPLHSGVTGDLRMAYIELQTKYAQADADRKVAEKRLQQVMDDVTTKDTQIHKAKYEILTASHIITETKKENEKAHAEIETLKKRVEKLEENRVRMMDSLLKIETMLQQERQLPNGFPGIFPGSGNPANKKGSF